MTRETLKTTLGIRPAQVPSFLALAESGTETLFTKRQAIRLLEVYDDLGELLQDISAVSSREVRRKLSANEKLLLSRLCDMRLEEACSNTLLSQGQTLHLSETTRPAQES